MLSTRTAFVIVMGRGIAPGIRPCLLAIGRPLRLQAQLVVLQLVQLLFQRRIHLQLHHQAPLTGMFLGRPLFSAPRARRMGTLSREATILML